MKYMSVTGIYTDDCYQSRFLPLPVHFYSPIPPLDVLEKRRIWDRVSELRGIDLRVTEQIELLNILGSRFAKECDWPLETDGDPNHFFLNNNSFSFGCAAALHSLIRHRKPRRIIEIGSGNSSRVINAAIEKNRAETGMVTEYLIIDPFPASSTTMLSALSETHVKMVEEVDENFFSTLGENDILFIDSGHTVRTGSDVNYLILDILPILAPGVLIHFHDIPMPYEYAKIYFTNPGFRVFWTESYLLQAFLSYNHDFEILLSMSYLMTEHKEIFSKAFPLYDPEGHTAISGSFWITKR